MENHEGTPVELPTVNEDELFALRLSGWIERVARFKPTSEYFARNEEITRAEKEYASSELEIDEDALVSRGDDGFWVQAWVWLPCPAEEDQEDTEPAPKED